MCVKVRTIATIFDDSIKIIIVTTVVIGPNKLITTMSWTECRVNGNIGTGTTQGDCHDGSLCQASGRCNGKWF